MNTDTPKRAKASLTPKRKRFARKYIELGNASEAYAQSYDAEGMSRPAIHTEAKRALQSPAVVSEVARLMALSDFHLSDVTEIHRRNMEQDKHLPTSQRAVETYYQLEGIMAKAEAPKLSVAFVIHTDSIPATDTPTFKTLPQE